MDAPAVYRVGPPDAQTRSVLFLSHATPEDKTFAKRLGSQLSIAGYEVCCDVSALLGGVNYSRREEARRDLFAYIEGFYNSRRLHSAIGYRSAADMERMAA